MKNLRLRVKEDGKVYVSAPYGVPLSVIESFVASREDWIAERRRELARKEKEAKTELSDGDIITILGGQYVIFVTEGSGEPFFEGSMLVVPLSEGDRLETAVLGFMGKLCRRVCTKAVEIYLKRAGYKGEPPEIEFKHYKSRWGSYNRRDNIISFNLALCKLSERYINYVAAHEVTHIFVHNHSEEFYAFGETIYENFFKTDRELNKIKSGGLFS